MTTDPGTPAPVAPAPTAIPAWFKWLSGGGSSALLIGAVEGWRRYTETSTAAFQKAIQAGEIQGLLDQLSAVAFDKAVEAGVLDKALTSCQATEKILAEALKACQ